MPDIPAVGACSPTDVASTPATSRGVVLTAPASAHTKGAWLQLIATTTIPAAWLAISVCAPGTDYRVLADIGVGAAAAEKVVIPDLYADCPGSGNNARARYYLFPVSIPVGSRVSARYQALTTADVCDVGVILIPSTFPGSSPLSRVEACGIVSGSTTLTQVDPGGSTNTDNTPVQIIASTSFPYKWVAITAAHSANNTGEGANYLADLMVGAGGSEKVLIPDLYFRNDTSTDSPSMVWSFPCSVTQGSRLSIRMRSGAVTATTRIHDFAVWGVG